MCNRTVLRCRTITPTAKLVHSYYWDRDNHDQSTGYTRPIREIADELGLSDVQFLRAFRLLCRLKLLEIGEELYVGGALQMIGAHAAKVAYVEDGREGNSGAVQ